MRISPAGRRKSPSLILLNSGEVPMEGFLQNQRSRLSQFFGLILLLYCGSVAEAIVVSRVVGRVGDYFLTSREVLATRLIEKELFPDQKLKLADDISSPEFVMQVTAALLEKVVAVEAESFSVAAVTDEELKEMVAAGKKNLSGVRTWQKLNISMAELHEMVLRKLRSKKFLKYKTDAASLTVTDFEIKDYYEKNRYKFGNLPLDSFKDNIRQYLIQRQTEDRLREWFEVLRKKYQVRNFMAEAN